MEVSGAILTAGVFLLPGYGWKGGHLKGGYHPKIGWGTPYSRQGEGPNFSAGHFSWFGTIDLVAGNRVHGYLILCGEGSVHLQLRYIRKCAASKTSKYTVLKSFFAVQQRECEKKR